MGFCPYSQESDKVNGGDIIGCPELRISSKDTCPTYRFGNCERNKEGKFKVDA